MTITLTYLDDLSRVQIELSGLTDGAVAVQRSLNPSAGDTLWADGTVRGGTALPIQGGTGLIDDYEFAANSENHYRVLDESGDVIESDSITPDLEGHAWMKSVRHPFLNTLVEDAEILALEQGQSIGRAARDDLVSVVGRSAPTAVTDVRGSRVFGVRFAVADEAAAARMDLVLASGDVFFLQVPPVLGPHVPGGYVRVESVQHRPADTVRWRFTLQCTVVTPPAPEVTGSLLTWGTVARLYGSWAALVNAKPTWRDLLATVGSPDDLVTP